MPETPKRSAEVNKLFGDLFSAERSSARTTHQIAVLAALDAYDRIVSDPVARMEFVVNATAEHYGLAETSEPAEEPVPSPPYPNGSVATHRCGLTYVRADDDEWFIARPSGVLIRSDEFRTDELVSRAVARDDMTVPVVPDEFPTGTVLKSTNGYDSTRWRKASNGDWTYSNTAIGEHWTYSNTAIGEQRSLRYRNGDSKVAADLHQGVILIDKLPTIQTEEN